MAEMAYELVGGAPGDSGDKQSYEHIKELSQSDPAVAKLVRQKQQWRDKFNGLLQEQSQMKQELAQMRGQMQGMAPQQQQGQPRSIQEMSDGQLQEATMSALSQEDGGAQLLALDELIARRAREIAAGEREKAVQDVTHAQHRDGVMSYLEREYGNDQGIIDEESDLYQVAIREIGGLKQRYGADVMERYPELAKGAFATAWKATQAPRLTKELGELRTEREKRMQAEALERGAVAGARANEDVQSSLKEGDIRGAIRNTSLVRSLTR